MPRISLSPHPPPGSPAEGERPLSNVAFDGVIVTLCAWFLGGLYLDGWAHQHIAEAELETFFTPWHAMLYSGLFASAGALGLTVLWNWRGGYPVMRASPVGYEWSFLGVLIFLVGGLGDMTWHLLFGFEADLEALLSPTHLLLALGATLILTGPLRAAWHRTDAHSWAALWPMLVSLTLLLSVLTFFSQYAHPFASTMAAEPHRPSAALFGSMTGRGLARVTFYAQALGLISLLLQTALLMGVVLLAVRRWPLPWGSLTLLLGLNITLLTLMRDKGYHSNPLDTGAFPLIAVAILGGMAADSLLWRLRPSAARPAAFRLFAFAVPTIVYGLYFLALQLTGGGVWWSIHLWAGAIGMAGVVGLLMSFLVVPPPVKD